MSGATLRMQACGAAKAFSRRRMGRKSRRRRMPWVPIALRWRRVVAMAVRVPGRTGALRSAMRLVCRSTTNLHMHLQVNAAPAQQGGARTTPRLHDASRRALHAAPVEMSRQSSLSDARANAGKAIMSKPQSTTAILRPSTRVASVTMSARATPVKRHISIAKMQLGQRASASSMPEAHVPVVGRPGALLMLPRSLRAPQIARFVASSQSKPICAFATRSPDLVWCTRAPPQVDIDRPPHAQTSTPTALQAPGHKVELETLPDARAILRTQTIDPAFVDHVADDVIRRIDRRLRIERERRGL